MNINPFELMKNFQGLQTKLNDTQEKLKNVKVIGSAGGDIVQVEMNGRFEVLGVRIAKEAVDPEDIKMLEDLIRAAFSDALIKLKEAIRTEMSELTGGIPPGFFGV
ncbi:MAG TPA: YbaB/EbfC family nucleoid-associated protein [Spirochaetales bacterium]|nr:YbaB/EbfC family nucleoid-associated protein [Spirochaetales bacterium]